MLEQDLRKLIEDVCRGRLPRRAFLQHMGCLGVSLPLAAAMLGGAGQTQAQMLGQSPAYKPTRRGGGGPLRLLMWQGPTLLNPHFATGTKDEEGSAVFYEGLARWDADGNLLPVLAAEIPSRENGGLSADGKTVTWKLKKGVTWHDGTPFTADDVVFNWQYASDPATAAITSGIYRDLKFEKVDSHTVRVVYGKPSPFWPEGYSVMNLIPRHLFSAYSGAKSREAPANLKPVGTGPYKFVDFKPGDMLRGEINTGYHQPNKPFFDTLEMKGGGDSISAARAVLQTGESDYAWNLAVEDDVLKRLEAGNRGRVVFSPGGTIEALLLNYSDPHTEVDGERSHARTRHPAFSDPAVVKAMGLLVDRQAIQNFIYGRSGAATPNFVNNPVRFRSPNLKAEFNIEKANALLDAAGWKRGGDGVREKGGVKLKLVFQTSISSPRQKVQAIIKQACQKTGIEVELKAVVSSMFFSSDVGNPDTTGKFYADIQMYGMDQGRPDPERQIQRFVSWEIASKSNKWLGRNVARWRSQEFDQIYNTAEGELDPVKRAALFIRMNDLVCSEGYVIPLMSRPKVTGLANKLFAPLSGWARDMDTLADWYREA